MTACFYYKKEEEDSSQETDLDRLLFDLRVEYTKCDPLQRFHRNTVNRSIGEWAYRYPSSYGR